MRETFPSAATGTEMAVTLPSMDRVAVVPAAGYAPEAPIAVVTATVVRTATTGSTASGARDGTLAPWRAASSVVDEPVGL